MNSDGLDSDNGAELINQEIIPENLNPRWMWSNFSAFKVGLKQKLCSFIFKQKMEELGGDFHETGAYFRYLFPYLDELRVVRMNFLGPDTMFIKMIHLSVGFDLVARW